MKDYFAKERPSALRHHAESAIKGLKTRTINTQLEIMEKTISETAESGREAYVIPIAETPSTLGGVSHTFASKLQILATPTLLALADLAGLFLAASLALWLRHLIDPTHFPAGFQLSLFAYAGAALFSYLAVGLYTAAAYSGPEELRRLSITTTIISFVLTLSAYQERGLWNQSVSVFVISWALAVLLVPLSRALMRALFCRYPWWGLKVTIITACLDSGQRLCDLLRSQPRRGIKPIALISLEEPDHAHQTNGTIPKTMAQAISHVKELGAEGIIVLLKNFSHPQSTALIKRYENTFEHWLIVPDVTAFYSLWVSTRDLGGVLGLKVTHRLFNKWHRTVKRSLDLFLAVGGGLLIFPICLLIAFLIRIDSPGPILYGQYRIGRNGHVFKLLKFRSMHRNAEKLLENYLNRHPELQEEWKETQKLKDDPRTTRVGRVLRKTSLDELPQLLNVLRGEMSLVGPRPIVDEEISRYGEIWDLYKRVRPGITGQWQISGRNEISYAERTAMDAYYVRNWSVWLDVYILSRTLGVVLTGHGAY